MLFQCFWDSAGGTDPDHDQGGGRGMLGRRTCRAKWAPAVRTGAAGERPSQQIRRRFNKFGADSMHIESDSIFGADSINIDSDSIFRRRFSKY